ncbi:hypothetical protein MN608_08238 [Microdochium nivale]|nr:hypothetical protein MN608_08238 [Microdochium nivale]
MAFQVLDPDYESQAQARIQDYMSDDGVLRGYKCDITLPQLLARPGGNRLACRETAEETTFVSAHISTRIHAAYGQLAAYAAQEADTAIAQEGIDLLIEVADQDFDSSPPCKHRVYSSRRLQLHSPQSLPSLPFVHTLRVTTGGPGGGDDFEAARVRPLSLLLPLQCVASLPNITTLRAPWLWERPMPYPFSGRAMREYTRPWEGPLRDARHEFGAAMLEPNKKHLLGAGIPTSLTKAMLHFWEPRQTSGEDQAVARPNLVHPAQQDPLSLGLCKLAAQLEMLDLRALVTEHLFPGAESERWSRMQRLRVEFHPLRPDGRWYFTGPGGEDPHDSEDGGFVISAETDYPPEHDTSAEEETDTEYELRGPTGGSERDYIQDMFRVAPARDRVEPLLAAFARAVADMPELRDAELFAYLWWDPSHDRMDEFEYWEGEDRPYGEQLEEDDYADGIVHKWGVRYLTGRGKRAADDGDDEGVNGDHDDAAATTTPVVQWHVGDWRPSPEVMSLFEAMGAQEWLEFDIDEGRSRDEPLF